MNTYKSIAELKASARAHLKGNYPALIIGLLVYGFIASSINMVTDLFPEGQDMTGAIIMFLVAVLVGAITVKLRFGLTGCYLKACCNKRPKVLDIFEPLVRGSRSSTGLAIVITTISIFCSFPALIAIMYYEDLVTISPVLPIIVSVLSLVLLIYYKISLLPVFYLVHDLPEKTALQILLVNSWLIKGQRLKLLKLTLSFIPLYILGITSFGIGFLYIYPYVYSTETCFYLDLSESKSNE